ncbi:MAG: hypothetical protein ACE14S_01080 [Candidatus Bathyarchaeia archaeon]
MHDDIKYYYTPVYIHAFCFVITAAKTRNELVDLSVIRLERNAS